jgi:nucleotide-binding universal stress UspA family protein
MGDTLRVVAAWEFPMSYGWAPQLPPGFDPSDDAERMLREVVDDVVGTEGHVEIETVVVEGQPAPTLINAARGADLLVVGTRGHGELAGIFYGSVGERCVTHAPCPVVVVRGKAA